MSLKGGGTPTNSMEKTRPPSFGHYICSHLPLLIIVTIISMTLRLILFQYTGLTSLLQHRFELVSPLTSFTRLEACLDTSQYHTSSLLTQLQSSQPFHLFVSPYDSMICTIPVPLLIFGQSISMILLSSPILSSFLTFNHAIFVCVCLADIFTAINLFGLIYIYVKYPITVPESVQSFIQTYVPISLKTASKPSLKTTSEPVPAPSPCVVHPDQTEQAILQTKSQQQQQHSDIAIAPLLFVFYLLNPISIASSLALNLASFSFCLFSILLVICLWFPPHVFMCLFQGFLLGLLIALDPSFVYIIIPIIGLLYIQKPTILSCIFRTFVILFPIFVINSLIIIIESVFNASLYNILCFWDIIMTSRHDVILLSSSVPKTVLLSSIMALFGRISHDMAIILPFIRTILNTNIYAQHLYHQLLAQSHNQEIRLLTISFSTSFWTFPFATQRHFLFDYSLRPNIGCLWYFFIQIFHRFAYFFTLIFPIPLTIHSVTITIRFIASFPLFSIAIIHALSTIFHPFPTHLHSIFSLALILVNFPVYRPKMHRISFIALLLAHVSAGMTVMWQLWADLGSGNVNFIFFQGVFFAFGSLLGVIELISAARRLQVVPPGLLDHIDPS